MLSMSLLHSQKQEFEKNKKKHRKRMSENRYDGE